MSNPQKIHQQARDIVAQMHSSATADLIRRGHRDTEFAPVLRDISAVIDQRDKAIAVVNFIANSNEPLIASTAQMIRDKAREFVRSGQ